MKKLPILRKSSENLFHLAYNVALIGKGHLIAYLWVNDVTGPPEVRDDGYGATGEGFENDTCPEVANRWKYQHIRGAQSLEDLRVADPTTEGNLLLDPKKSGKLLKAVPFRAISKHREASQTASQQRGGGA